MGFTQITFLFAFLPISILIYLATNKIFGLNTRISNAVLVCENLLFFWWAEPKLLVFFIILTILVYILGNKMYIAKDVKEKREWLICAIAIFIIVPVICKYMPELRYTTVDGQLAALPAFSDILVPLGISFFVLEAISYLADIYTEKTLPGSIIDVFLFMTLFPKAVSGPVVLWRDFKPQIHERKADNNSVSSGLKKIIIGYAKKAIIADTFAESIILLNTKIMECTTDSAAVWLLAVLYFFRIYYDFSGYSDIAIGLCNIFGFDIGENFEQPYLSGSLTDFWRRWHISLGRWFREYIYIPLGGNRSGSLYINIFITFIVAGLWHGWRITILLWAVINGLIVIIEKMIRNKEWYQKIPKRFRIIITVFIVCMGWLLFRAPDMMAAGEIFKGLIISPGGNTPNFTWRFFLTARNTVFLVIAAAGAFGLLGRMAAFMKAKMNMTVYDILEKAILLILFAVSIIFVLGTSYTPFIYNSF